MTIITLPQSAGGKSFFNYESIEFNEDSTDGAYFILSNGTTIWYSKFILANYINDFSKKREIYHNIIKTHNPTIVRNLFRILYSSNFEFEGNDLELIITLLEISKLAGLLNIHELSNGIISLMKYDHDSRELYIDVIRHDNKKITLTYSDCFTILEHLNNIKIFANSEKKIMNLYHLILYKNILIMHTTLLVHILKNLIMMIL